MNKLLNCSLFLPDDTTQFAPFCSSVGDMEFDGLKKTERNNNIFQRTMPLTELQDTKMRTARSHFSLFSELMLTGVAHQSFL